MQSNRRNFLKLSGFGIAAFAIPDISQSANSLDKKAQSLPIRLGLASYTLRKLNLDDAFAICQRLNINHISLKNFHLKLTSSDSEIIWFDNLIISKDNENLKTLI